MFRKAPGELSFTLMDKFMDDRESRLLKFTTNCIFNIYIYGCLTSSTNCMKTRLNSNFLDLHVWCKTLVSLTEQITVFSEQYNYVDCDVSIKYVTC